MANDSNIIERIIRIVFDRNAARKAEGDAKASTDKVDGFLSKLKKGALAVGGAIAAAFAVRGIARFLGESVRIAGEATAIWNRLGQAVTNAGGNFAELEGEVRLAAAAVQDLTTVGDEDFASAFTEVLGITNDYNTSLAIMPDVLDLAAAKQIDLMTAAQLYGRVITGDTALLKRYGIVVEEGADALEVMRERFRGFAEKEAQSFAGRMKQLNNAMSDFREAIGNVLIESVNGEGILRGLTLAVQRLTKWIDANRQALAQFGKTTGIVLGAVAREIRAIVGLFTNLFAVVSNLLIGTFAQTTTAILSLVNGAIDALNIFVRAANLIPGVDVGLLNHITFGDKTEEQWRQATKTSWALLRENIGKTGESVLDIATAWAKVAERTDEATASLEYADIKAKQSSADLAKAAEERAKALDAEVKALVRGAELRVLSATEEGRLRDIEREIIAVLGEGNLALEARIALVERLKAVSAATAGLDAAARVNASPVPGRATPDGLSASIGVQRPLITALGAADVNRILRNQRANWDDYFDGIAEKAAAAGTIMTNGFQSFFDAAIKGFQETGSAVSAFAQGFVGLGKFIIGQLLEGFAEAEFAKGVASLAEGTWPPNPAAFAAAGLHFAAAGLFKALASATSGGGSRSAGGSSSIASSQRFQGARVQEREPLAPEFHAHFGGEFSHLNPEVQDVVYWANRNAEEKKTAGARVFVHKAGSITVSRSST